MHTRLTVYIAYTHRIPEQYMHTMLTVYIAYTDSIHEQYMRMLLTIHMAYTNIHEQHTDMKTSVRA